MRIFLLRFTGTHIKPTYTPQPIQRNPLTQIEYKRPQELKCDENENLHICCIISELFANVPHESSESH